MWLRIKTFFASKGGFSHATAAAFGSLCVLYDKVAPFQSLVKQVAHHLPLWVTTLTVAAVGIYAWYKDTNK